MSSNVASGKSYVATNVWASWPDTGGTELTDGVVSSGFPGSTTEVVGWYQTAHDVTIDLGSQYVLDYCRFYSSVWLPAGVPAEVSVEIFGSNDDVFYSSLGSFTRGVDWLDTNGNQWTNNLSVSGTYQYIKFSFPTPGAGNVAANAEFEVYGDTPSSIKTINGLVKTSVKTVNSLVIASVKTINGLS